jgi:hypothetical protein
MIKNFEDIREISTTIVVSWLHNHPTIEFILTGSRAGLNATHELSDYDFYAKDTPETRTYLETCDFSLLTIAYQGDPQITCVYRHKHAPVDVQLTNDVRKKTLVQDVIKKHRLVAHQYKSFASSVWSAMYELLDRKEEAL